MSKSQRTKLLEQACRAAINNALVARKKLAAAVEEDGDDVFVRPFLTLEEHSRIVRRQRREMEASHQGQMDAVLQHFASLKDHFKAQRAAEDMPGRRREQFRIVPAAAEPGEDEYVASAEKIIRAGKVRRGELDK